MDNEKTGKAMKMVTFRRPQGEDTIVIPLGDDPGKHVRPSLILKVQEIPNEVPTHQTTRGRRATLDRATTALRSIAEWANAYPLTRFPEPDLGAARVVLEAAGMSLDALQASAMRHVVTRVAAIAKEGLGE